MPGRPYLDGLRYQIIRERGTATAALQTRRVDVAFPGETPKPIADQLRSTVPRLVITPVGTAVIDHLLMNATRPPFDNPKVRLALSRAIDRRGFIEALYQGGAARGASMAPKPHGVWGLLDGELQALPGHGGASEEKAKARALLAEAGFGAGNPLKLEMQTRGLPAFVDIASFVVNELKRVGIDAGLRQVETAQWEPQKVRGDFTFASDRTAMEPDDPDATFYEHYACGSSRNHSRYCDPELTRLIDQQSQELDRAKRHALVRTIQRKLEDAGVSPVLSWRLDYFAAWPHVKNLVPHHSIYSWGRLQDVWVDPAVTPRP
jgi:peptide/nickel transport system substrate-binding protein